MSYSFTDLLSSIITARSVNEPHTALGHYATLSDHCSMTPLLWLQYAQESIAVDKSLALAKEIGELALDEFPGCALLWIFYFDVSAATDLDSESSGEMRINAMKNLKGLQTTPFIMLEFYRFAAKCFPSKAEEIYIKRAYSLLHGNESIVSEMQSFVKENGNISPKTFSAVDDGRKFVSQNLSILNRYEEDVVASMTRETIQLPPTFSFLDYLAEKDRDALKHTHQLHYNWQGIIDAMGGIEGQILMGCGMMQSASSFLNYIQGLFQHIKLLKKQAQKEEKSGDQEGFKDTTDLISLFTDFIAPVYERAISECPTVEMLWEKFVKHLMYIFHDEESSNTPARRADVLIQLQNITSRAVKNCPYSLKLFSMKMQVVAKEVEAGQKLLEPDDLMKIVSEAVDGKFLPDRKSHLDVHLSACRVVKRRILHLVSKATSSMSYDESERLDKESKKKRRRGEDVELKQFTAPLEGDAEQEVHDLIEDLRDMFESTDAFLRKHYTEWTEGRYLLYREKANIEAYICSPLVDDCARSSEIVVKCFEKLVRIHNPPHPNVWRDYIRYMMGKTFVEKSIDDDDDEQTGKITEMPGMVLGKLRFIRNMYQRALSSLKKPNHTTDLTQSNAEYSAAMGLLCEEYKHFESMFGSDKSSLAASKLVSKKLISIQENGADKGNAISVPDERAQNIPNDSKRKREEMSGSRSAAEEGIEGSSVKRAKVGTIINEDIESKDKGDEVAAPSTNEDDRKKKPVNIWPIKPKPEHVVKIGKLEYPAHPFTVHVANLSSVTMDMDLYDFFRVKCGAIVHVRIFRDKQYGHGRGQTPKSKCAGLVQFEERESVEKALQISGEFGLHEKLFVVTRSHQPAVGVVPPGMQRINEKGNGKHTKRNVKRKERRGAANKDGDGNSETLKAENGEGEGSANAKDVAERGKEVKKPSSSNILAFRPRNVGKKGLRKKKVGL